MYEIFSDVPPNQNSGAAPVYSTVYTRILYIYVVTCAAPPKFLYVADPMLCLYIISRDYIVEY